MDWLYHKTLVYIYRICKIKLILILILILIHIYKKA